VVDARADSDHDRVCESEASHLLVTAPPGTGKTFLTIRLAATIAPSLPAGGRVLVLTFSNQARTQLEYEAQRQLDVGLRKRIDVSNYHRFFWRVVLAYRRLLGIPMEIDVGSERRRQAALEEALGKDAVKTIKASPGLLSSLAEHQFGDFQDDRTPEPELLAGALKVIEDEQRQGRLVFNDLGALFWSLIGRFPSVRAAYLDRYPVVLADEHQDASALQDAVVRQLATRRLAVFADPMQLIHGFRGASQERLEDHRRDCDGAETLSTPHRWHRSEHLAAWLMEVRARLSGETRPGSAPEEITIVQTDAKKGMGMVKAQVKYAVADAFKRGHQSVAVLALTNQDVAGLRNYLSNEGFHPRQIGTADFEDARIDIEQLPQLHDAESVAGHAIDRVEELVPTLGRSAFDQARRRIGPDGVDLHRAGAAAKLILQPLVMLYEDGPCRYFDALIDVIDGAISKGHHVPRAEAVYAIRQTSAALAGQEPDLQMALNRYSFDVMAASQAAPRTTRGLYVMTAHQAKGKEFDVVVLAGANEQFFPDKADSRRLFYVAITRASEEWVVITPDSKPSPLLAALGS
jgi:superfamily I DNA/RNA helicase